MSHRAAIRLGFLSAALFAAGSAAWAFGWPAPGSDPSVIANFYASRQTRIEYGGAVSAFALALFIPFAAAVAMTIARRDRVLALTAAIGAAILVVGGLSAETINLAGAVRGAHDPGVARILYEIPQVFGSYMAGIGLGVFAIATGLSRVLPREWSAILIVIGAALLTPATLVVREFAGAGFVLVALIVAITIKPDPT